MSKIWLFNECCGLQKDVPHTQTLSDADGPQMSGEKFEKSSSKIISSAEFKVQKPREFTVFHINSACFGGVLLTNPFGI